MLILIVPLLLLLLLIVAIVLLVLRRWVAGSVVALLMVVLNYWTETVPLHPGYLLTDTQQVTSEPNTLRVLTYNIGLQSRYVGGTATDSLTTFTEMLYQYNPDVLVLPESRIWSKPRLRQELEQRYPYRLTDAYRGKEPYVETAIYSRYPMSHMRTIGKHYIYCADLTLPNGKEATIAACHLSSNQFHSQLNGGNGLISNLSAGFDRRLDEARELCDSLATRHTGIIVCGDLNDLSGSPAVNALQEQLQLNDAWWRGGCGYGATFSGKGLTLRLDHILYSNHFELNNVVIPAVKLSDHKPLMAEFSL